MLGPEPSPADTDDAARSAAALAAENALLRAQVRRARLLLDSATDHAIVTMDRDGCVTGWNAGAERLLGYAAAEILGRSGEIVLTFEDRAAGRLAAEMRRAVETGGVACERWHMRRDGTRFWASGTMLPLRDEAGRPDGVLAILRDGTEARTETELRTLLMAEMGHRIRNTFATVQAVAALTRRHSPDSAGFQTAFDARLGLLARSHDVLLRTDWHDAALHDLIECALDAYGGEPGRITVEGAPATLAAGHAVAASLAFHELATNAVKHGALSAPQGRVAVTWSVARLAPGAERADILWRERGGPAVQPPARRGFGSRLLEGGLPPGGTVRLDFRPDGLECRLRLPLLAEARTRGRRTPGEGAAPLRPGPGRRAGSRQC